MRVLFVLRSWGIGGEQRAASLITGGLIASGWDVSLRVLNHRPAGPTVSLDARVKTSFGDMSSGQQTIGLTRHLYALRRFIRSGKFDVVIGFGTAAATMTSLAAAGLPTPVVICERNDPARYPRHWRVLRALAYSVATGAVFQTKDACQYFPRGYFRHRRVIPNPVHPAAQKIDCGQTKDSRRQKVVVNTSRLTPPKNQLMLVRAFSAIATRHPEYRVEMYGEGPMRPAIQAEVKRNGLEDRICIHPPREDILERVAQCEVFVLTSDHEGFPNSLAEAMCLGLAVVATDCRIGGPRTMIADGWNGRLIPVGDVDALSSVLDEILTDSDRLRLLGKQASQLAAELAPERVVKSWIDFLRQVLDTSRTVLPGAPWTSGASS